MGFGCGTGSCCLGLIVGFIAAIVVAVAATFGVYCYFNPEARNESVDVVESKWEKIKVGGDEIIDKARSSEPKVTFDVD